MYNLKLGRGKTTNAKAHLDSTPAATGTPLSAHESYSSTVSVHDRFGNLGVDPMRSPNLHGTASGKHKAPGGPSALPMNIPSSSRPIGEFMQPSLFSSIARTTRISSLAKTDSAEGQHQPLPHAPPATNDFSFFNLPFGPDSPDISDKVLDGLVNEIIMDEPTLDSGSSPRPPSLSPSKLDVDASSSGAAATYGKIPVSPSASSTSSKTAGNLRCSKGCGACDGCREAKRLKNRAKRMKKKKRKERKEVERANQTDTKKAEHVKRKQSHKSESSDRKKQLKASQNSVSASSAASGQTNKAQPQRNNSSKGKNADNKPLRNGDDCTTDAGKQTAGDERPVSGKTNLKQKQKSDKEKEVALGVFLGAGSEDPELNVDVDTVITRYGLDDGVHWCRYCGARAASGWNSSPWGALKLCTTHYVAWHVTKTLDLSSFREEPKKPIAPEHNTETKFAAYVVRSRKTVVGGDSGNGGIKRLPFNDILKVQAQVRNALRQPPKLSGAHMFPHAGRVLSNQDSDGTSVGSPSLMGSGRTSASSSHASSPNQSGVGPKGNSLRDFLNATSADGFLDIPKSDSFNKYSMTKLGYGTIGKLQAKLLNLPKYNSPRKTAAEEEEEEDEEMRGIDREKDRKDRREKLRCRSNTSSPVKRGPLLEEKREDELNSVAKYHEERERASLEMKTMLVNSFVGNSSISNRVITQEAIQLARSRFEARGVSPSGASPPSTSLSSPVSTGGHLASASVPAQAQSPTRRKKLVPATPPNSMRGMDGVKEGTLCQFRYDAIVNLFRRNNEFVIRDVAASLGMTGPAADELVEEVLEESIQQLFRP